MHAGRCMGIPPTERLDFSRSFTARRRNRYDTTSSCLDYFERYLHVRARAYFMRRASPAPSFRHISPRASRAGWQAWGKRAGRQWDRSRWRESRLGGSCCEPKLPLARQTRPLLRHASAESGLGKARPTTPRERDAPACGCSFPSRAVHALHLVTPSSLPTFPPSHLEPPPRRDPPAIYPLLRPPIPRHPHSGPRLRKHDPLMTSPDAMKRECLYACNS